MARKIQPALERGEIVLSARNYISTLVYQGRGEGYDESEILRLTELFTDEKYLKPDVMVILSLSREKREERISMRGELKNPDTFESRGQDFQKKVDDGYLEIAEAYGIPVVSADGTIDEVHDMLIDNIKKTLVKPLDFIDVFSVIMSSYRSSVFMAGENCE